MDATITNEHIQQLAESAKPYNLALLWWGPERHMDGAAAIELEHQRRMVSLRADGIISILCPVSVETLAGVAVMNVEPEEAREIMHGDPCVQASMILCHICACHGFPGRRVAWVTDSRLTPWWLRPHAPLWQGVLGGQIGGSELATH